MRTLSQIIEIDKKYNVTSLSKCSARHFINIYFIPHTAITSFWIFGILSNKQLIILDKLEQYKNVT